jgi:hypothetical protein
VRGQTLEASGEERMIEWGQCRGWMVQWPKISHWRGCRGHLARHTALIYRIATARTFAAARILSSPPYVQNSSVTHTRHQVFNHAIHQVFNQ